MKPSLFIGLVTHPRSRFVSASEPGGLQQQLASTMRAHDWQIHTAVCAENLIDPSGIDLSTSAIRASIDRESAVEVEWSRFQSSGAPTTRDMARISLQKVARYWRYLRPSRSARAAGKAMLLRLANIEKAHMQIMREGIESGADWALILEDDAWSRDPQSLGSEFNEHLQAWNLMPTPKFANVSGSFPLAGLNLHQSLAAVGSWSPSSQILSAPVPFTNTVCAIAYRREFLADTLRELEGIPLEPIIPIDWKLNLALMRTSRKGLVGPGDCYTVDPAPILQGSMHPPS